MSNVKYPSSNTQTKLGFRYCLTNQTGVSSMMVLILAVLLIIVGWEIGQFAKTFSKSGQEIPSFATGNRCTGSNTAFDCYDQDEGTDFVDSPTP
jgi:hypothetical protein